MPDMNDAYHNEIANAGSDLINYIGLVDEEGNEITTVGEIYSRQAVTWTSAPTGGIAGLVRPTEDLVFGIPAGTTVGGWRGYSHEDSATPGDTDYGGKTLDHETYANEGEYRLLAAETGIKHESPD